MADVSWFLRLLRIQYNDDFFWLSAGSNLQKDLTTRYPQRCQTCTEVWFRFPRQRRLALRLDSAPHPTPLPQIILKQHIVISFLLIVNKNIKFVLRILTQKHNSKLIGFTCVKQCCQRLIIIIWDTGVSGDTALIAPPSLPNPPQSAWRSQLRFYQEDDNNDETQPNEVLAGGWRLKCFWEPSAFCV